MPAGEVARPAAPAPPTPKAAENREARVSPTPAPLKPSQRRLALRDERLAHKHASREHVVTARRPHKQYFTGDEARRLFSTTMRSRDRPLRDLVTDADQLARYGLPVWQTEEALAGALELDRKALRRFSIHSAGDRSMHYVTFAIPKRSGGERLIMAPKARLKRLQRRLHALLVSKLPVSEFAHGFRNGHSVRSNAEPHVGRNVILQLDLKDFFGSIHFGRVRGLLIAFGYGFPVATVLATLMTEAPRQPVMVGETRFFPPAGPRACPQGAPTSPGLSNAVVVKMDRRLAGLAQRYGFVYTRYADDLTFSGDDIAAAHALRLLARRVVEEEGFALNDDKTRLTRSGSRQTVTGVVVNDVLGLSRQERRRLRAAIHQYANAHAAGNADPALLARLDGKVAYVSMLNAGQAHRLAPRSSSG
jgi:RNA-directed DNA polymerase